MNDFTKDVTKKQIDAFISFQEKMKIAHKNGYIEVDNIGVKIIGAKPGYTITVLEDGMVEHTKVKDE